MVNKESYRTVPHTSPVYNSSSCKEPGQHKYSFPKIHAFNSQDCPIPKYKVLYQFLQTYNTFSWA